MCQLERTQEYDAGSETKVPSGNIWIVNAKKSAHPSSHSNNVNMWLELLIRGRNPQDRWTPGLLE